MMKGKTAIVTTIMAETRSAGPVAIRMSFDSLPLVDDEIYAPLGDNALKLRVRGCRRFGTEESDTLSIILDCEEIPC